MIGLTIVLKQQEENYSMSTEKLGAPTKEHSTGEHSWQGKSCIECRTKDEERPPEETASNSFPCRETFSDDNSKLNKITRNNISSTTVPVAKMAKDRPWGPIQPLYPAGDNLYPIESEHPIIRNAAIEISKNDGIDIAMAASVAKAYRAATTQGRYSLIIDENKGPLPTSQYVLIVAPSGSGKTTVANYLESPFRDFQLKESRASKLAMDKYRGDLKSWDRELRAYGQRLENICKKHGHSKSEEALQIKAKIVETESNKPIKPKEPNTLKTDITTEKLISCLANDWPSVIISSSDGGSFTGSWSLKPENAPKTYSFYNDIWSGKGSSTERMSEDKIVWGNVRVSKCIQTQPGAFKEFIRTPVGKLGLANGYFARCRIVYVKTSSYRSPLKVNPPLMAVSALNELNAEILNKKLNWDGEGMLIFEPIRLSKDAREAARVFEQRFDKEFNTKYKTIQPFVLRSVEKASREAGDNAVSNNLLFGKKLEINEELIINALKIEEVHLVDTLSLFGLWKDPTFQVYQWLLDHCKEMNFCLEEAYIRRNSSIKYFKKREIEKSIEILSEKNMARFSPDNGKFIEINPRILDME
jgi:hypothetical protein